MFASLGRFIYRWRWAVLVAGVGFLIAGALLGTEVFGSLKGGGFFDPNAESTKVYNAIPEKLGRDEGALIVLFTSSDGVQVDSPTYKQAVEDTLAKVAGRPGVGRITTFYNSGAAQLVSNDRQSTYAVVGMTGDAEAQQERVKDLRPLLSSARLQVRLGGQPAVGEEINEQVSKDLETAETLTFPILAVLLVFIFGSLVAASLPLAVGGFVILGSFLILRIAANFTDVSVFAINVITMLGLGLAIDYSLFMVSRFREELKNGDGDVAAALGVTMQRAGRTVVFSGLTVMISLLSLMVFSMMFLKSMGLGGAAAVFGAMLAALTVLPALLAVLGTRVNSLKVGSLLRLGRNRTQQPGARRAATATGAPSGFWYRTSQFVMRYPLVVLVATLVPLVLVGLPFLRATFSTPDAHSLPAGRESRVVSEMLTGSFPRNETQPIQVLVAGSRDALAPASIEALYDYTRQVGALPHVKRVDSLVDLDSRMDRAAYVSFYSESMRARDPRAAQAAEHFAGGNYSLVTVVYDSDPLSQTSQDLVRNIRTLHPPAGLSAQVGGDPARLVDFLDSLAASVPLALFLIVTAVFLLLFLMLGSLVVPLKAVALNILSLSVSFGALVWVFQEGNLSGLLGFTPLGSIDGTQPILIFAIAFGLSMDYEVFLLSRIKEHYDQTGDTRAAVAQGVQKTGAIITSAALLLVVVIGAFSTGEVLFIKEIGVGLSLAILVDATVVRMLLVPATMRLLGRYNWWAPAPLSTLYRRLNLGEVEYEKPRAVARELEPAGG